MYIIFAENRDAYCIKPRVIHTICNMYQWSVDIRRTGNVQQFD